MVGAIITPFGVGGSDAAAGAPAASVPAATSGSTRVLVMPVFWGARPPTTPTPTTLRQNLIAGSAAWFGEVSHDLYTVDGGTVTRWLRIPRPAHCRGGDLITTTIARQAQAAARRAGYRPSRYDRFVYYIPCGNGFGQGTLGGREVWLFNSYTSKKATHEQGHNLGLPHANARWCTNRTWGPVTWSSTCALEEYGDQFDTMGYYNNGHYNAYFKSRLGWLQRSTTVSSTKTVTLTPYETSGPGLKAVRVRAGAATYWLEFRTSTGFDRFIPASAAGVQIRYQAPDGTTQLLDAAPGTAPGRADFGDVHLPAGSSWTTPQDVRITVTAQTPSQATVAIRFNASPPKAPNPPSPVDARGFLDDSARGARITWTRPADNGSIIRRYVITHLDDGTTRIVPATGGLATSYRWLSIDVTKPHRFAVTAISQAGTSATATADMRPLILGPSVTIDSPANGATVSGLVPIQMRATPNATTRAPIFAVELYIDDVYQGDDEVAPWGPFEWDTRGLTNGSHTIKIRVLDQSGNDATTTAQVTVSNPTEPPTSTG
jgi:hypothetical protein